jgi:polymorphic toxin system DSP-PTPase phosphatase-like protein
VSELFVLTDTPALLAGMPYPPPDTDWQALHDRGFRLVVRLQPGAYDPGPLDARDVTLTDLYGGALPDDPAAEAERVWEAARIAAGAVQGGTGVVVHCVGGTGRTGTVLACALRLLGRSADEAIAMVQAHRPKWPESPWQEGLVRSV